MKRILKAAAVIPMVMIMTSGAFAATTATVKATVKKTCAAIVGGVVDFGEIDPSAGAAVSKAALSADTTVQCTKSVPMITVTADSLNGNSGVGTSSTNGTLSGSMVSGTNYLNYTLTFNSSFSGGGFGGATPTVLIDKAGGTILAVDAAAADYAVGASYSDTVTITLAY